MMSKVVQILEKIAAKEAKIYSYRGQFGELWKLDELVSTSQNNTLVIVWDEIPTSKRNDVIATSKYLTPIDWAVAFSLAIHRKTSSKKLAYPFLKILILDLNSQSASNAGSVKLVNQFPKREVMSMPWIRLFRPFEAETFIKNIMNKATGDDEVPSMYEYANGNALDLSVMHNLWTASLTRLSTPGDHHAIANLVGPLLLSDENSSTHDSHVKALANLMRALGLIAHEIEDENGKKQEAEQKENPFLKDGNPWIKWDNTEWEKKLQRVVKNGGKLNILLVDDQYQLGWGKVLCHAVGANYGQGPKDGDFFTLGAYREFITVKATSSIEWLLEKITGSDQRFKFKIDENTCENSAEILFLDLRLFSGKALDTEIKFFAKLCSIAERFIDRKEKDTTVIPSTIRLAENLPWLGFSYEEIEDVKKWYAPENGNKKREDAPYIAALTFLPRILALTDLALPIVLFSSTGRRDITEKLKYYGNIYTDFDKPKFAMDMPEDIAGVTGEKFEKAFGRALGCLAVRVGIKDLLKKCGAVTMPIKEKPVNDKFASLFIDESGDGSADKPLVLAGIMAVADTKYKLDAFEAHLLKNKPNWTIGGGLLKYCASIQEYEINGNSIIEHASNCGVSLTGVALAQGGDNDELSPDMLLDDHVLDNLHRNMLRTLIEIVISYVVPNIAGGRKLNLSIYSDIRSLPVDKMKADEPKIADILFKKFGIRAKDNSPGGRFLEFNSLVNNLESQAKIPTIYVSENGGYLQTKISDLIRNLMVNDSSLNPTGEKFYVLDEKDVYPIVSSVLEEYRYSNLKTEIDVAKGLMVPDPNTLKAGTVSQLMHFADWLPRMVCFGRQDVRWLSIGWVSQLLKQGHIGNYDSSLDGLLRTRRLFMEGADSAAIDSLLNVIFENRSSAFPNTLNQILLTDIWGSLQIVSGYAFVNSSEINGDIQTTTQKHLKIFSIIRINLRNNLVELKSEGGETLNVSLDIWKTSLIDIRFLPPLIGDKVSVVVSRRGYGGEYKTEKVVLSEPIKSQCRFGGKLEGKVFKDLSNSNFLIKGPDELGDALIFCGQQKGLRVGDTVTFTLKRDTPFSTQKGPWSLKAVEVIKIGMDSQ